ncbi:hypothetical protein LSCM1_08278 [Leishmania martiniquensis]|uniref:Uncharacterized protein n=1 Tax=Leishmania martiniquensis TaxID=1580590 RepID=A0A836I4U4_9TRYP|nr:hypothetical protein LSCM1_08278 [Leishmania martiniquensis]
MSEELILQWTKRVSDAEEELSRMEADIGSIKQQRKLLRADIRRYEDVVASEKCDLLTSLEGVEAQAKDLGTQCEATLAEKDRVEAEYMATLDAYESLHFLVREIKDAEEHLQSREDLEACLQRESVTWAEEEHSLRRKLHQLQQQQAQARRAQEAELRAQEAELSKVEQRQREERAGRCGEAAQAASRVVRSSRQQTPVPPKFGTLAVENAFVSANAGGAVPTRSAPLKSCLRALINGNAATANPRPSAPASAPVSRCASQSLVSDSAASGIRRQGVDGSDQHSLQVLQEMRAYPYGAPCKVGARKRDFLGDATNHQ